MVSYCLELPYGRVVHFPAGTYREQVDTWIGRTELDAMSIVQRAWFMFEHLSKGDWKKGELKFFQWLMEEPKEPPTDRANELIALLWGASFWVLRLLGRRDD